MSRRYQQGCLFREKRKAGPDVWVFRFRDGQTNRKEQLGTVEQLPNKSAAKKACELLRANVNRETRSPRTVAELVAHFTRTELTEDGRRAYSTRTAYESYLRLWILPAWKDHSLSDVHTVNVEAWLATLPMADGSRAKIRNLMSAIFTHAMRHEWTDRNPIRLVRCSVKSAQMYAPT